MRARFHMRYLFGLVNDEDFVHNTLFVERETPLEGSAQSTETTTFTLHT